MGTLTNTIRAVVIVYGAGGEEYEIAPGQTVEVDRKTDWPGHPYVAAGALVHNVQAEQQGKGKKGA